MSAQAYTIREVSSRTRDWDGQGGSKNRSYYVKVDGDERVFELAQKVDRDPPKTGDTLEATVESREHNGETYYKLKRVYQQGGRNNGGRSYGHSPEERASIERQVAAKVAGELLVAVIGQGKVPVTPDGGNLLEGLATAHRDLAKSIALEIKG